MTNRIYFGFMFADSWMKPSVHIPYHCAAFASRFSHRKWRSGQCDRYLYPTSSKYLYPCKSDHARLCVDGGARPSKDEFCTGVESEYPMRCSRCGYEHALYGLSYSAGTLQRHITDRTTQMLKIGGGAWSFSSALLDCHPEIKRLVVEDDAGTVWRVDRETFDLYAR